MHQDSEGDKPNWEIRLSLRKDVALFGEGLSALCLPGYPLPDKEEAVPPWSPIYRTIHDM